MDALKDTVSSLLDLFSMEFQFKMYIKPVILFPSIKCTKETLDKTFQTCQK